MAEFRWLDPGRVENEDVVEIRMGLPGQQSFPMDLYKSILDAHRAIRPRVEVTPLQHSPALSSAFGCNVLLKHESMQPTGSFKLRGATNKIRCLLERGGVKQVLAASTGNHGLAVARAGKLADVAVTVYVSNSAAPSKMAGIRALGAEIIVVDGTPLDAELVARRTAEAQGLTYISPYNDLDVVAGQGTLGVELLEQEARLDAVFIAVGGGGLIGGAGTAIKAVNSHVEVVGVWPAASPCMLRALQAGQIVPVEEQETLSDGTAGAIEPGSVTLPICQAVIDQTVEVSEAQIATAMRQLAEKEHLMVEGSAGVALAGLAMKAQEFQGKTVAVVLCGRNIGLETFIAAIGKP